MIAHLLLLLASCAFASTDTLKGLDDESMRLSNLAKDVRDLQSGRPTITGLPTFRNGIEFGDGTIQTTAASAGILKQRVSSTTCDYWSVRGAAIPADTSIPQISEGWQVLVVTGTPVGASNWAYLTAYVVLNEPSNVCNNGVMTFFQDATANAICSQPFDAGSTANTPRVVTGFCRVATGSTTQRNYSIRVGCDTTNGIAVNANTAGSGQFYGTGTSSTVCSHLIFEEKTQ